MANTISRTGITVNGIGTTFYGQARFRRDGSFVTTKWFVICWFPFFPMKSYRLRYIEGDENSCELLEELPVDRVQAIKVWAYAFTIVPCVSFILVTSVVAIIPNTVLGYVLATVFVLLTMALGYLPGLLRLRAKFRAGG
ncbi:MAG: hypothetical protein LBO00_02865 [Zoogloeaceae bacterium]|nr:hypothetical protein [Zoogloeaceae bacterium]